MGVTEQLKFVQEFYKRLDLEEMDMTDFLSEVKPEDIDALIPMFQDILEGSLSYGMGTSETQKEVNMEPTTNGQNGENGENDKLVAEIPYSLRKVRLGNYMYEQDRE